MYNPATKVNVAARNPAKAIIKALAPLLLNNSLTSAFNPIADMAIEDATIIPGSIFLLSPIDDLTAIPNIKATINGSSSGECNIFVKKYPVKPIRTATDKPAFISFKDCPILCLFIDYV